MANTNKIIASISISGEITLNLHSLNNEGGEGNHILTRQVTIVDKAGETHTVNAISGDMFKHIHAVHLAQIAKEQKLPLSKYAEALNPNRISGEELGSYAKNNIAKANGTAADVIDAMIDICTVCDTHGILITDKIGENKNSSNTPRKSTVEFGWAVGIPNKTNTESYLHTKLVTNAGSTETTGSNEGQNIFHRPANHGVYAFVCSIDVYRIGFNDISRKYPDGVDRTARYKALLQSLLSSFINPKGAMTSTQKPHITDFKGVVAISSKLTPAPTISAINEGYQEEITKIANSLNKIESDMIELREFDGLGNLSEIIADLMTYEPYKIS
ncbi:DevR family CRISPR-associated autoregulator [Flectobacillus sp. DC10W]|uniref:DevR family CRISPR-associated autoregulator n=1 Tax=Flectobacillus longus TaxID=2984207 RepID=A0ABT6YL85_9BACT|nr:DevR family CRISPR-associated autoregulator [Flectobacillus longus]MDI9863923.1 DevR family CRISPR-associated autoregulator [Flectobacillus longus]